MTLKEQTKQKIEDTKELILQMIPTRTSDLINDTDYNYGYLDSNLILHLLNVNATLSSSQTIVSSGSTMTINALVTDSDGNAVSNAPVQFYINGTASGNPINTNSNGIATYTYSGTGIGKVKVHAKIGTFQSEPSQVLDGTFYDKALDGSGNHNDNWGNPSLKVKVNRSATGTTLTMDSGVTWGQLYAQSQSTYFNLGFAVEFDVLDYSDTPAIRFANENSQSATHILTTGHWKISFKSDTIIVLKDGETQTHYLNTLIGSTKLKVYLELSADTDVLKYKNFVIYPI